LAKVLEVEIWGTGKPVREWLYVRDFASIVLRVIRNRSLFLDPVNVAQNSGQSVIELVDIIRISLIFLGMKCLIPNTRMVHPRK
jgi:GDP-L-fucose synthase